MTLDERRPGPLDGRAWRQVEGNLARPDELALDGEEPDTDAVRHQTRTPAPK